MKVTQYQQETKRTLPDLGSEAMNLAHMVLGMFSEDNELITALIKRDTVNIDEELADKFWYLSNYCNLRSYDLDFIINNNAVFEPDINTSFCDVELFALSKLQDFVKKNLAYSKPIDRLKEFYYLRMYTFGLLEVLEANDVDLEQILEKNIAKLRARFPDKFTEELAINRDTDKERKILES